jgi:hypothetical protein
VFVGTEDEDRTRHVRGVNKPHDLEERLANPVGDNIAPRLLSELGIIPGVGAMWSWRTLSGGTQRRLRSARRDLRRLPDLPRPSHDLHKRVVTHAAQELSALGRL